MVSFAFGLFLFQISATLLVQSGGSNTTSGTSQFSPFNLGEPAAGSSISSSNNGGCPQLPSNCNYDCLSIGKDGCIECTCTSSGTPGTGSLTGGSTLTSSGARNSSFTGPGSLIGGSSLTSSGAGIYNSSAMSGGLFSNPGSMYGGNNSSGSNGDQHLGNVGLGSLTGGSTLTSSGSNITANSGSLASFFSGKLGNSSTLSSTGNVFSVSSVSGNQGTVAQASMNNNGCPSFPSNCGSTCVTLDRMGCPICTCTQGGNSSVSSSPAGSLSSGSTLGGPSSASASQNLNGCPAFTNDCTAECVSLNSAGCPICTCHDAGSHSGQSSAHAQSSNANGCPTFYASCPATCVSLDGMGCPICTCNATSGTVSGSQLNVGPPSHGSPQNNNGCPPFPTNCRSECAALDSRTGCPLCTCTTATGNNSSDRFTGGSSYPNPYNQPDPGNSQQANGCPQFPNNCPGSCTTTNNNGCPVCTCAVPVVASSECPATPADCHESCLWEDSEGCIRCNGDCNASARSTSIPMPSTVDSGNIHVRTTPKPTSGSQGVTSGVPGTSSCASFDQNCPMNCVALDNQGCIVCTCVATTASSVPTTTTPTTIVSSTSQVTICPAFEAANCRVDCLAMDVKGCLICNCGASGTTAPPVAITTTPSSGLAPVTTFAPIMPTGTGSGCPPFDPSCAVDCTAIDAMGCITCSCPKNNTSAAGTGSTGPSVGGAGKNNGCPVFDTSCPPGCAMIDAMGCLHCTCSVTTVAPGSGGSSGSGGSGSGFPGSGTGGSSGGGSGFPGSGSSGTGGSCPPVDVMACQPSCLILGQDGCVTCTCSATTTSSPVNTGATQPTGSTVPPVKEITMVTKNPLNLHQTTQDQCPVFDPSCPASCTSVDLKGCPQCICPASTSTPRPTTPETTTARRMTTHAYTTTASHAPQTTSHAPGVCPPIRCLYPCDLGVSLGSDNCPVCKCRANTTTTKP